MSAMRRAVECAQVVDTLGAIGSQVLKARQEEEYLAVLADALRAQIDCDAVILRLLERYIQTRAVATRSRVETLPPDQLAERFDEEDQERWLSLADGIFCPDISTAPYIKPRFREQALGLGLRSGFMVPLIRDGEICGQLVFAWSEARELDAQAKESLRKLGDYACLMTTLFYLRKAQEMDSLTGLLNRAGLRRRWKVCEAAGQGVLLFADLDGFKAVNDTRGHLAGDDFLREVANLLHRCGNAGNVITRYGGDEFVILVPGARPDEGEVLRATIQEEFNKWVRSQPAPQPAITIGMAAWPEDGHELDALIGRADERMYEQKRNRRKMVIESVATAGYSIDGGSRSREGGERPHHGLSDAFFEAWLANSPDGVLVTDPNLRVVYVNPAYERVSGYARKEWIGKRPDFVASGKTPAEVYEEMWRHLRTEGTWMGQVINRRGYGEEWISFLSITEVRNHRDQLVGYMGVARDVTHQTRSGVFNTPIGIQAAFTQEALAFALAEAAEMHEGGSRQHLKRIQKITQILGEAAAQRYEELARPGFLQTIVQASILHDIGKMAIPQGLLTKPGRLSPEEYHLMKTHTIAGYQLLQSPSLRSPRLPASCLFIHTAARIARSHHERWDGSGYPDGLAGENIPLEARLVAIADVYDALRSRRPYKGRWSHEEAVGLIRSEAGRHFDPQLVDVFLSLEDKLQEIWANAELAEENGEPVASGGGAKGA